MVHQPTAIPTLADAPPEARGVAVLSTIPMFGYGAAASLRAAGARVHVVSDDAHSFARYSRFVHRHHIAPQAPMRRGDDAFLSDLNGLCRRWNLALVCPADTRPTRMLAARKDRVDAKPFPIPSPELFDRLNNKWSFASLLAEAGLPAPRTVLLRSADDARACDLRGPLVVKPLDAENGDGVRTLASIDELVSHLSDPGRAWPLLVQEFIPGHDIDLSLVADRGRVVAWTIQERVPHAPGRLRFLVNREALRIGERIAEASGLHGVAHIDMRLDERTGTPVVIECNPRFWGSMLQSLWAGVNFPAACARLALGMPPAPGFKPVEGECEAPGFSPRRLAGALLHGRFTPADMGPATARAWAMTHLDPLPFLVERLRRPRAKGNLAA